MNRHAITFLFLIAAIILYAIGFSMPATIFVGMGVIAELTFWVRLLRRNPRE